MHEKKSFSQRADEFLSGKGFYIVLFVCIAVIGVSAWLLLFSQYSPLLPGDEGDYLDVFGDSSVNQPKDDEANKGTNNAPATTPQKPDTTPTEPKKDDTGKESGGASTGDKDTLVLQDKPTKPNEPTADTPPEPEDEGPGEDGGDRVSEPGDISFIWPVTGAVIMEYSPDALIYNRTMADWRTHEGIDLGVQLGTKVMSAANGTVKEVYEDDFLGTTVVIDHGAGVVMNYSNLAAVPTVAAGDSVTAGSVIGSVGNTALYEAGDTPHLHLSMTIDGETADPGKYLPKR